MNAPALILFYVPLLTYISEVKTEPRIVGGTEVINRSEFAYQVLLLYNDGAVTQFCGGAIIDANHVLTAAHCCYFNNKLVEPDYLTVRVGNLDLNDQSNVKQVTGVFVHENFVNTEEEVKNDIAVLKIAGTFENSSNIHPINLTTHDSTSGKCNVSGWGTIYPGLEIMNRKLYFVEVPIVDWDSCNESYSNLDVNVICAGETGKDSCQGDSGGPFVCSGTLSGIVSFGFGCGLENYPGVYTNVASYVEWIQEQKTKSSNTRITSSSLLSISLVFLAAIITL